MTLTLKDYKTLTSEEHKKLLAIRNQKEVREASNDTSEILFKNHILWVKKLHPKRYFAVLYKDEIVGGANFEADGASVTNWGVFFDRTLAPFVPLAAVYSFMEYLFGSYNELFSQVKKQNEKALALNRYFGVEIEKENNTHFFMHITKQRWEERKKKLASITKRIEKVEIIA